MPPAAERSRPPMTSVKRAAVSVAAVVMLVGTGWAAGRATLAPPTGGVAAASVQTYTVEQGRVSKVLNFTATTSYAQRLLAYGGSQGTVTSVHVRPGQTVVAGARLFAVDERPVFIAAGSVPAYRNMSYGDTGRDVAQLQRFLNTQGQRDDTSTPDVGRDPLTRYDGEFDTATRAAVERWQQSAGTAVDGVVDQGELVFVPTLPARVQLGGSVSTGTRVSPGMETVFSLADAPRFEVVLSEEQRDLVPLDGTVVVRAGGDRWRGIIVGTEGRGTGDLVLALGTTSGRPLCGHQCARIPAGKESAYPVAIIAVPATRGPIVPAAALRSDESGQAFVNDEDGRRVPVTVLATDGGWSVVDGVTVGDVLNLGDGAFDDTRAAR